MVQKRAMLTSQLTAVEVPLLFPSLDPSVPRFTVNYEQQTVQRQTMKSSPNPHALVDEAIYDMRGTASISRLEGCIVTTSPLTEDPSVIVVSLVKRNGASPKLIHVDLSTHASSFGSPVKVQAAMWPDQSTDAHGSAISLIFINRHASIIRLKLCADTLVPVDESISVFLAGWHHKKALEEELVESSLTSSMVVVLSHSKVLLALNPFLFLADVDSGETYQWNKTECMDGMKRNRSYLYAIFSSKPSFVRCLDMPPVSALCVAENDPERVFSFHTDGVVRYWLLPRAPNTFVPVAVTEPAIDKIPRSEFWEANDPFAISMTARVLNEVYALAINIRTRVQDTGTSVDVHDGSENESIDEKNAISSLGSRGFSNLIVTEGPKDFQSEAKEYTIRLQTPPSASSVINMSFDYQDDGECSLLVLFNHLNNERGCIHTKYLPSKISLVSREPTILSEPWNLDAVAQHEKFRIAKLTFLEDRSLLSRSMSTEDRLQYVDKCFLKFLFRPTYPRGTGSIRPPLAIHIRSALNRLIKGRLSSLGHLSIEGETLQSMHEWRRKGNSVLSWSQEPRKMPGVSSPGDGGNLHSVSIYDSVLKPEVLAMRAESPDAMVVDQVDSPGDWEAECRAHEQRWRRLLLEIWREEKRERASLCFSVTSTGVNSASFVVRCGSVAMVSYTVKKTRSPAQELDRVAQSAINHLEKTQKNEQVDRFDRQVQESIRLCQLGVDPSIVDELFESLEQASRVIQITKENSDRVKNSLRQLTGDLRTEIEFAESFFLKERSMVTLRPGTVGIHQRLSAASLCVRGIEVIRSQCLGRLLVLKALNINSQCPTLFKLFVRASTCLFVASQMIDTRFVGEASTAIQPLQLKQVDFSNVNQSVPDASKWKVCEKMTSIESLMIYLANDHEVSAENSLASPVLDLAHEAFQRYLCPEKSMFKDVPLLNLASIPPKSGRLVDEPKLAVRLLAVDVAMPEDNDQNVRLESMFAECLLIGSRSEPRALARNMVNAAVRLLPFVPSDLEASMHNVEKLLRHLMGHKESSSPLRKFIMQAIDKIRIGQQEQEKLWFMLFTVSLEAGDWEAAMNAAVDCPDTGNRRDRLERLIRAMIDAGALKSLCQMCSCLELSMEESELIDSVSNTSDLYLIATDTLQANSRRDLYSYLAEDHEPFSDYLGALFALHVSQDQWTRAAEALYARYLRAQNGLARNVEGCGLTPEGLNQREKIIVDDLVLASVGCLFSLGQVQGKDGTFLAPQVEKWQAAGMPRKILPFQSQAEVAARASWSICLKRLFFDESIEAKSFAVSSFSDESVFDYDFETCIDHLFTFGYYHEGLGLARIESLAMPSKPSGVDVFADATSHLLCTYLVPLASGYLLPTKRPTLSQLHAAFETTSSPLKGPPVMTLRSGVALSSLYAAAVKVGAHALCESLTTRYTSSGLQVAVEVAEAFLFAEDGSCQLPAWLEQFLTHGTATKYRPGLFAKTSIAKEEYFGNPSALMDLLMKRGLYARACRLVVEVVSGGGSWDRKASAASRLPEKGDIDYVPYDKIDLLWNLIEESLQRGVPGMHNVLGARTEMEDAIDEHFKLLRISEMGISSARMLVD